MKNENKIILDFSQFHYQHECEFEVKLPSGVIIQFPKVYIDKAEYDINHHREYAEDKFGTLLMSANTKLIESISGEFKLIPLIASDGVQYREIREVKA